MSLDGRPETPAPGQVEGGLEEPTELEPEQGTLSLTSPDDEYGRAAWEAAAAAVLRKARRLTDEDDDSLIWQKLTRATLDGIGVMPLGVPDDVVGLGTAGRPTRTGDWDVRSPLGSADAKALNETALVDLENGATSLWLEATADLDLATVLDGVLLDLAPVVLDADDQVAVARALLDVAGETKLAAGTNLGGRDDSLVEVATLARDAGVLGVVVDATSVHDRGASDVQELAHSLAVAVAGLRTLAGAGFDVDGAAALMEFRYAATDEQFPTIAKLRAARRLWARVLELSGAGDVAQRQHVVTSRPMMSKYDPYVNMLRTCVAAFAAGVGGADAVSVLPFDSPIGQPDAFARRIARNTNALLMHESHVAEVADPAGGAYAVEKLTDDLATAAWDLFCRLDGGEPLDPLIEQTVAQREREIATRERPITGLSEFPNLAEQLPERVSTSSTTGDGSIYGASVRRYGASFEALRDEPVARPVFLATLGPVAEHTARATFATNLLAAGGIAVELAGATAGVDELVAAYDGQPVVCLAGSDPTYAEWGSDAVAALREAGAQHVIAAGKPDAVQGADDSCAVGVDALEFLTRTREKLA